MKVSDVMNKYVVSVSENTPLKEIGRLIFSLGISGVPVLKGKKLVGIVTEQDILSHMFPTMKDIVEDYSKARDFEGMEKRMVELLDNPASKLMNKKVTTITSDMSLMKAQSMMLINNFSRLPIVDKNKNLIGIVSQGDIFRQLIKNEIPRIEKDKYADFIASYYDSMIDWNKRIKFESGALLKLFKKEKATNILDLGVWTGEHTIQMVKKTGNISYLGLDHNPTMIKMSIDKIRNSSENIKKNVKFLLTNFDDFDSKIKQKYDIAICMGGSLPYIPLPISKLMKNVKNVLREKNPLIILQILNFDKILNSGDNLLDFKIQELRGEKHLFIEFFEKLNAKKLLHHVILFDHDGINWIYKGITTIDIYNYSLKDIKNALKKAGFKKISFFGNKGEYQGEYGKLSFTDKFDLKESDWLNVVAKR